MDIIRFCWKSHFWNLQASYSIAVYFVSLGVLVLNLKLLSPCVRRRCHAHKLDRKAVLGCPNVRKFYWSALERGYLAAMMMMMMMRKGGGGLEEGGNVKNDRISVFGRDANEQTNIERTSTWHSPPSEFRFPNDWTPGGDSGLNKGGISHIPKGN